ncbi:MAG: hypothetical protein HQK86_13185 [Nitrospinae bacterium]|nr:hypothetical protein [Nitrospinota bacterium]MBF0633696.1 hypothetical protein [Nitrospinota bacterium]
MCKALLISGAKTGVSPGFLAPPLYVIIDLINNHHPQMKTAVGQNGGASRGAMKARVTFVSVMESAPDFAIAFALLVFWISPLTLSPHVNLVHIEAIITLEFFAILSGWFMSFAFMLFQTPVFRYIVAGIIAYIFVIGFGTDFARLTGEAWPILSLLALMINRTAAAMVTEQKAQGAFLFAWSIVHLLMLMAAGIIQVFPIPDFGLTMQALAEMARISPPLTEHAAKTMAQPDKYIAWTFMYFVISGAGSLFYLSGLKENVESYMLDPARDADAEKGERWTPREELTAVIVLLVAIAWIVQPWKPPLSKSELQQGAWRAGEAQKLHKKNMERVAKENADKEAKAHRRAR